MRLRQGFSPSRDRQGAQLFCVEPRFLRQSEVSSIQHQIPIKQGLPCPPKPAQRRTQRRLRLAYLGQNDVAAWIQ